MKYHQNFREISAITAGIMTFYFNEIPVKFHQNFCEILVKLHWNFIKITVKKMVIIPAVFAEISVIVFTGMHSHT